MKIAALIITTTTAALGSAALGQIAAIGQAEWLARMFSELSALGLM